METFGALYVNKIHEKTSIDKAKYEELIGKFNNKNIDVIEIKKLIDFFEKLKKYNKEDDLKWIVKNNRILMYNILKYHNEEGNVIYTINRDMKVLT